MNNITITKALVQALNELNAMSPEQLKAELLAHKDGEFATALRETSEFLGTFDHTLSTTWNKMGDHPAVWQDYISTHGGDLDINRFYIGTPGTETEVFPGDIIVKRTDGTYQAYPRALDH